MQHVSWFWKIVQFQLLFFLSFLFGFYFVYNLFFHPFWVWFSLPNWLYNFVSWFGRFFFTPSLLASISFSTHSYLCSSPSGVTYSSHFSHLAVPPLPASKRPNIHRCSWMVRVLLLAWLLRMLRWQLMATGEKLLPLSTGARKIMWSPIILQNSVSNKRKEIIYIMLIERKG